ncbi:MAG: hypothetical protein KY410_09220, partial [Proteobacteria bacterium]|nr:hypothetical protein [Pseudomonadota bacterium]
TTEATLGTNWRSDAALLEALDLVYGGAALGHERIVVRPVRAAHGRSRLTGAGAPLRLRRLPRTGPGRVWRGMPAVGRLRDAVEDMSHWNEFRYVVINDEFHAALSQLKSILRGKGEWNRSDRSELQPLIRSLLAQSNTPG